ncbi:MAG: hypothetical protein K2X43_21510 [Hyphomonadaceae bacterium]|nr:hypothetical protein [Hyphomonadaceae bacterium]
MTQERPASPAENGSRELLPAPVKVVNVGLPSFAEELASGGVEVIQVTWSPPAGGDPEIADLVSKLGA